MPENARITSLEVLDSFRNSLLVYLEKAARAVESIDEEIVSTRLWLQGDRRVYWEAQVRRLTTELDLKQQELFSARISNLQSDTLVEQKAVQKVQRALEAATGKLTLVKQYNRQYENHVAPMAKEVEKARSFLATDMRHAVATLTQTLNTLNAYADVRVPGQTAATVATPAPAAAADSPGAATGGPS